MQWPHAHCGLQDPPAHLGHIPAPQREKTPHSQPFLFPPLLLWVLKQEENLSAWAGRDQRSSSTLLDRIPRFQHEPPLLPVLAAFSDSELSDWTGTSSRGVSSRGFEILDLGMVKEVITICRGGWKKATCLSSEKTQRWLGSFGMSTYTPELPFCILQWGNVGRDNPVQEIA